MLKQFFFRVISLLVAITLLLCASACTTYSSGSVSVIGGETSSLSMNFSPRFVEMKQADDGFKTAMAELSMKLFREAVTKDNKNDNFSPLSAVLCLSLIANGADGETRAEMETLFGLSVEDMNKYLKSYVSGLYSGENCKVSIANSIWFRNDGSLHVRNDFLQTNADYYGSEAYAAPFDKTTVKEVNDWVEKNTDGLIKEILKKISANSAMFLVNTLLFDAKWLDQYTDRQISENCDFANYDGSVSKVNYLISEENRYFEGKDFKGFLKQYEGSKYSFAGILPDKDTDIYSLIKSLDGKTWMNTVGKAENREINAVIPEFSFATEELDMTAMLKKLGMRKAFDKGSADFSKMGTSDRGPLYLDYVKQKTYIEVNRNGTKAAAVTWGEMCGGCVESIVLNRPFIYAIVDNETGLPLFIGAVTSL